MSGPTGREARAGLARAEVWRVLSTRAVRMTLVLLLLWAGLGVSPTTRAAFLTAGNLSNLTAQVAEIVIVGAGMTLVIILGGIDLSVGAGMALAGVVAARLSIDAREPAAVAVLAALSVGALVGLWHGLLVTRFQVPPFIATLSGFLAYRGLALVLSGARGLSPMRPDFLVLAARVPPRATALLCLAACGVGVLLVVLGAERRRRLGLAPEPVVTLALRVAAIAAVTLFALAVYGGGVPVPVLLAAATTALGALLLRRARLGRYALAIGGNAEAARLSGVPVERATVLVYLLTGVLTALAGVVAAARVNGVTPGNMGATRELHVISAVVIGGTSLAGGSGTMIGTVVGALVFGTLSNGMNLMSVDSNWQLVLTGAILLAASLLDAKERRPSSRGPLSRVALPLAFGAAAAAALALFAFVRRGAIEPGVPSALPAAAVAAANAASQQNDAALQHRAPKVALLLSTLQEERYQKDRAFFEAAARRRGLDPFTLAADNDNGRQLAQVEDALTLGAKVLVVQPTDSGAASAYVGRAHDRGAMVVAYDRFIPQDASGRGADFYVAHDSREVGVMQARAAVAATGGRGSYVLLDGQSGHSVAVEIARGYHDVLDPLVAKGAIRIAAERSHDAWAPEQALRTVEDALAKEGGHLDAILANNSGMARGAVQAAQAAGLLAPGRAKVFIAGADADAANVNFVCEGKQSIEIEKPIGPLAERAADVAAALVRGERPLGDTTFAGTPTAAVPVVLITADNARRALVGGGFHAASDLPACH